MRVHAAVRLVLAWAAALPCAAAHAQETPPDSALARSDSALALPDSVTAPAALYTPSVLLEALSLLRPGRSADEEQILFRNREDAIEPPGIATLAAHLRLVPGARTREMTQGPAAESFDLSGAGSSRSALLLRGSSMALPGTSGPLTHEIVLSEIDGFSVVRGDAAALYGPDAVGGAVLALPRHPMPDQLTSRATAEEGVDDWQRGAFQIARRIGTSGGLFASVESRRIEGFFPGTKEVDRHFGATYAGRARGFEGSVGLRHFEADGRHGSFDPESVRVVLTKRDDLFVKLFRPTSHGGALLEADLAREKLETGIGGPEALTREFSVPMLRLTADLPSVRGAQWIARVEGRRVKVSRDDAAGHDPFLGGAAVLRATLPRGASFVTATTRLDLEEGRPGTPQARVEGEWARGALAAFVIGARGERLPDRGAARDDEPEVHTSVTGGARWATGPLRWRVALFARRVADARREPTFEELRARAAVLDAPEGDTRIRGATIGLQSETFAFPGVPAIGDLQLRTSWTQRSAENTTTGERLPRRAEGAWAGDGALERRFFSGELLARVRGRLTHLRDRVDDAGDPVNNAWVTDVLLEGEVGDAVFFYRFHDLLERADEIEPGIRLPGFSRMWGVSWRFVG